MRFILTLLLVLMFPATAATEETEVDLELVLMVDVSRSMTGHELEIQRRGYASALRSDAVWNAVRSGLLQRIALTYVEWAGSQQVIVDWQLIESRADLLAFADDVSVSYPASMRRTSISGALQFGTLMLGSNGYAGLRRVIDISGDGPNNQGHPVVQARDATVAEGIVINGLPLMTREGSDPRWHLDDLDIYYRTCVIGGPGAFVIPVLDWKDFAEAVRRKLVLEIAGVTPGPRIIRAQAELTDATDCLIGEKKWRQRQMFWGPP